MRERTPKDRRIPAWFVFAGLLALSVLIRIVFLVQLHRSDLSDLLSLDSSFYRDLAKSIAAGTPIPPGALTFNPLYPFFLALDFRLFGPGLLAPRIIQLLLGVLVVALVYKAAFRLVNDPRKGRLSPEATAVIAAVMAIFYSQFVLYEGTIIATAIEIALLTASYALALALDDDLGEKRPLTVRNRRVPAWLSGLLLGAFIGLGALGRPNLFLLLLAAIPAWLIVKNRRNRRGLRPAAAFLVGAAIFLVPPIAYNAAATGRFVPVTAQAGVNFYIGNWPGSTGGFTPPDNFRSDMLGMVEDAKAIAESETGRSLNRTEVSDYFFRKAIRGIEDHPGAWFRLLGKKLVLFFSGVEIPDLPNVFFSEKSCGVLRLLPISFAVIAPLALCGFYVLLRSGRNRSVVSIFLACGVMSVLPFFFLSRFRLPMVPVMISLAALFIVWAAREISQRRLRPVGILALCAVAFFFLVSQRSSTHVNQSAAYAFLGGYYFDKNEGAKAAEAFAEAYRLDPNRVEPMLNYAYILRRQGDLQKSVELYARAYALAPRLPRLAIDYGSTLEMVGRREDARKLYMEEFTNGRPPEKVLACRYLAQLAYAGGQREEAISWLQQALTITPGDPQILGTLKQIQSAP